MSDDWKSLIYMANAVNDPTAAWKQVQGEGKEKEGGEERRRDGESKGREQEERRVMFINDETGVASWGSGNTNTNGFWWIASRPGTTGSTCANTPSNGPSIDSGISFSSLPLSLSLLPFLSGLIQSVSNGMYLTIGAGSNAFITGNLQSGAILTFAAVAGIMREVKGGKGRRRGGEEMRYSEGEERIRGMGSNLLCRGYHDSVQRHQAIRIHR